MDPEAPGLSDYLGDVGRIGLDLIAAQGDMVVVPGIQKYIIPCNWKLAADNVWDFYHPAITHASSTMTRWRPLAAPPAADRFATPHIVVRGDYGHAISGPEVTEETRAQQANNAIHPAGATGPKLMPCSGRPGPASATIPTSSPTAG